MNKQNTCTHCGADLERNQDHSLGCLSRNLSFAEIEEMISQRKNLIAALAHIERACSPSGLAENQNMEELLSFITNVRHIASEELAFLGSLEVQP